MDELVKSLRELCEMTALCDDYNSCFECPYYEEECGSYKNGRLSAVYRQAADAIEQLSNAGSAYGRGWTLGYDAGRAESKPRWIPVEERLPEEMDRSCGGWSAEIRPSDDVLVWLSHEKRQSVAWYSHTYNEWTTVDENTVYCFEEITHWQPLSQPPKEES